MKYVKHLMITSCIALLASCASTQDTSDVVTVEDKSEYLYLRGSFTWFDAEDEFKVQQLDSQLYRTTVDLVADGQAYEFKFADETWAKGHNCGYESKAEDEVVTLEHKVTANCFAKYEFFRFTPAESGKYNFFVDFSQNDKRPHVWIEKYQPDLFDNIVEPIQRSLPDL